MLKIWLNSVANKLTRGINKPDIGTAYIIRLLMRKISNPMMNFTSLKTMQLGVRNCLYNSRVSCRTTAGICRLNRLTQLITTYNRVTLLVYLFLVESLSYRQSVNPYVS